MFSFFLISQESRFCFREKHGFAFARVTAVPLGNEKKNTFSIFFPSARVMVLLPREARLCFRESHGRASRKRKKTRFLFFFLSRESRFCFRERHGFASTRVTAVPLGNEKKRIFYFFFLPRESRFCFHERHGCDFRKGKKTVLPVRCFRPVFFVLFFL